MIIKAKSCYIVGDSTSITRCQTIEVTRFQKKRLPIKYLGCVLFTGRKRIEYFSDMVQNFERKMAGWKAKLLSTGRRIVLIKHVLQSLPIYSLAALDPPKTVINRINSICANFFYGVKGRMASNTVGFHGRNVVILSI